MVERKNKTGGRNNVGRITTRHTGGGHKKHYRVIDFKRTKDGIPATIERLEYDPNRSAHIALLKYADGERRYIIAPKGMQIGDPVRSGIDAPIKVGSTLPLRNIPVGSVIHCVELKPGKGAQLARSAGASVQLVAGKVLMPPSACAQVKCVRCLLTVAQRWVKCPTANTASSSLVKRVHHVGAANGQQYVVLL